MFNRNKSIEKEEKPTPKWVSVFMGVILTLILLVVFCISQSHWIFALNPSTVKEYMENGENGHYIKDTTTLCNGSYFKMRHTINGIPVCTEYYYLCGNESNNTVYVVRANKNFYNKFDPASGTNVSGVKISGLIRTPSYELGNAMAITKNDISDGDYDINMMTKYIDLMSFHVAIGILVGYILIGTAITLFVVFGKNNVKTDSKIIGPAAVLSLVAGCLVILHFINYIM